MHKKILMILLGLCAFSSAAFASQSYQLNFDRAYGHFSCTIDAPDDAAVIIEPEHIKVKGYFCTGRSLLLSVKDVNQYAFAWRVHGLDPKVKISVIGNVKSLNCQDAPAGRIDAPGKECFSPTE